ncbi:hypothetical protein GOP47_0009722 [Adiantum capillus-veneris]|uniref:Uncharacterized protein n=1 Tax=Adiantum capillus-veneris TaxID=13818 RepID=A0A9D4UX57_ADICA|nr:hypothetical protein GOP47_0009722 [Adiantum capillus-veneris]
MRAVATMTAMPLIAATTMALALVASMVVVNIAALATLTTMLIITTASLPAIGTWPLSPPVVKVPQSLERG